MTTLNIVKVIFSGLIECIIKTGNAGGDSEVVERYRTRALKWSGKFGQRAKVYPTRTNGYENDKATELFRQFQSYCGA